MKKGFILGLATGVILTGASLVFANSQIQAILNDQIKVTLNGQIQEFRDETTNEIQYPITYKDRTYLPLRTVANLVGVDVDYNASSNTAILKTKDNGIIQNESEEELIKKYKLSDDISLTYDMKESLYNLFGRSSDNSCTIYINGFAHIVSVKTNENRKAVLFIDDKEINSAIDDEYFNRKSIYEMGLIYIDEKPFIVKHWTEGGIGGNILYSITNNLELKYEKGFEEIYKIGEKYIAPEFFQEDDADHYGSGFVIGYWYYEDGEWKYINRSINGKILIDEEGNLSDDLKIDRLNYFGRGMFYDGFYVNKNESDIALISMSKYRIKKVYKDLYRVFDIEMLEDSIWGYVDANEALEHPEKFDENGNWTGEIKNKEIIKAGTIVKEVKIH